MPVPPTMPTRYFFSIGSSSPLPHRPRVRIGRPVHPLSLTNSLCVRWAYLPLGAARSAPGQKNYSTPAAGLSSAARAFLPLCRRYPRFGFFFFHPSLLFPFPPQYSIMEELEHRSSKARAERPPGRWGLLWKNAWIIRNCWTWPPKLAFTCWKTGRRSTVWKIPSAGSSWLTEYRKWMFLPCRPPSSSPSTRRMPTH